jgi:hypothetical protein
MKSLIFGFSRSLCVSNPPIGRIAHTSERSVFRFPFVRWTIATSARRVRTRNAHQTFDFYSFGFIGMGCGAIREQCRSPSSSGQNGPDLGLRPAARSVSVHSPSGRTPLADVVTIVCPWRPVDAYQTGEANRCVAVIPCSCISVWLAKSCGSGIAPVQTNEATLRSKPSVFELSY